VSVNDFFFHPSSKIAKNKNHSVAPGNNENNSKPSKQQKMKSKCLFGKSRRLPLLCSSAQHLLIPQTTIAKSTVVTFMRML